MADSSREVRRKIAALRTTMEHMGEEDMGGLTYAEASLFHGATDLINRLLEALYNRAVDEQIAEVSNV